MLYTEPEAIQHAKDLILALEYDKAREILAQYPRNPTAKRWLAKLDQIAPQMEMFPFDQPESNINPPYLNPISLNALDTSQMWNPLVSVFLMVSLMFAPFAPLVLIWNWRRYGKTSWAIQMVVLSILGLFGIITTGIVWIILYDDWASQRGMSMMLTVCIFYVTFWVGIFFIQYNLFRIHNRTPLYGVFPDPTAICRRWALWISLPATLLTVVISIGLFMTSFDETYENEFLQLTYSTPNWDEVPPQEVAYCREQVGIDCVFALTSDPSEDTTIAIVAIPIDVPINLVQFDRLWWDLAPDVFGQELVERSHDKVLIDGISAYKREFFPAHEDDYYMTIHLIYADYIIEIVVWSIDREEYQDTRKHFNNVIDSIEFKQPQS